MKVVLTSSHSANNKAVFDLTTKNHSEYCKRHDYTYMPVEEPYHPKLDIPFVKKLINEYDVVVNIGCDVVIQHPETPITVYANPGVTVGRELLGTLNGDLILFTKEAMSTVDAIDKLHRYMGSSQDAINFLAKHNNGIFVEPWLQIAAKELNTHLDYTYVCYNDYFAVHYQKIGYVPVINEKVKYLSASEILKQRSE